MHTQVITVKDDTNPTITNEANDLTLECDGSGNTTAIQNWIDSNGGATATDNCSPINSITWTNNYNGLSNQCGETGDAVVTFTATDLCGNASQTTGLITIEDTTEPSFDINPIDQTVQCDGAGNQAQYQDWLDRNGEALASDICGTATITHNAAGLSNDCGETGFETVTFTATDDCGNSSTRTATFTIEDTTNPTACEPDDLIHECTGAAANESTAAAWNAANIAKLEACAADDCAGITVVSDYNYGNLTNDCGTTGSFTVIYTITDECDNSITREATFTVEDTGSPVIETEAQNQTVECDGEGNLTQLQEWLNSNGGAIASDICSAFEWTNNFTELSDDCGETGEVTVTFTVTDDCNNTSQTTATFTIEDTTAPTPICQDITIQLDGNCEASITPEDIDNGSFDVCGDIANLSLSQIDFNCLDNEGANTVTLTVTDDCGNEATCNATVTVERFDLALRTVLAPGEDERVYPTDDVTFKIEVHNQGSLAASNIQIINYIPNGFELNDSDWNQTGANATITLPGTLAPGDMTMVEITLTVTQTTAGQLVNAAEIASADAPAGFSSIDVDSQADSDSNNDSGGQVNTDNDDEIDEGCCSIDGDDEDDSDPEDVTVEVFDLALSKVLATGEDDLVYPGQDITFTINVFNQGTVLAQNIELVDYIPTGLTLNDADWAEAGGNATITLPGTLAPGTSTSVDITFTVDATNTATQLINRAEIFDASDDLGDNTIPDIDSTPDDTNGNDNGGDVNTATDDEINDDGTIDEDDEDPEDINVQIFDLALRKTLGDGEDVRVYPGQDITFTIEVFNQGTADASNIEITDYIPSGLTLNDSDWSGAGNTATITLPGTLVAGASTTVDITFTVDATTSDADVINVAEISDAEDGNGDSVANGDIPDNDSTPDTDPNNDPGGEVNGNTDDTVDNQNGDEDDSDPEDVEIRIFDLALDKKLAAGEDELVYPGQDVTFTITVYNQGTVPAQNVEITDYIPCLLYTSPSPRDS